MPLLGPRIFNLGDFLSPDVIVIIVTILCLHLLLHISASITLAISVARWEKAPPLLLSLLEIATRGINMAATVGEVD